ncbi:ribonuclease H-like YkuK family protein [Sphingobacterium sp. SRCM116780]|uniref:ribonuclease H-like YkuK family protein n=1 Tax=Sphingobacterium sp. SRCM116780 TaxID=2907623 RepID=UPI001F3571E7|nr:ribonuclease H-like YkuK family protein [Sphingobacterium sp. SRCM116780]UIR55339.1 ribonuclease H-like YkuK family protein [Sphingobacterium sp. SRCM116780]
MNWQKYNGESIKTSIRDAVETNILREIALGNKLKVYIGTDSQVKRGTIDFATVIVFLREHRGGFMFVHKDKRYHLMSIKERMLLEVQKSIEVAYQLCPLLEQYQVDLEVHADINTNPNFQSNVALKEAMGYIMGMGFVFKAKPESFASTTCANKQVQ